jgi:hypothetical protein
MKKNLFRLFWILLGLISACKFSYDAGGYFPCAQDGSCSEGCTCLDHNICIPSREDTEFCCDVGEKLCNGECIETDMCCENCVEDCTDQDGDGYGVGPGCAVQDCDDTRNDIHPVADEGLNAPGTCDDSADNDCDQQTDTQDPDCRACTSPSDCDDTNICTGEECNNGVCGHTNNDGVGCNDENACTQTDTCQGGTCTGANPVICTALDQCHDAGTCNTGTGICSSQAKTNGTACNDGNACTQTDTCHNGTCTGSNPVGCAASDPCQDVGTCNPRTGTCFYPAKTDGTGCNDGLFCTDPDTCTAGVCGGPPRICLDVDPYTTDTCDEGLGVCVHKSCWVGNGTFAPKVDYPAGTNPYSVAMGDFNSDEILDMAEANEGASTVSVLLGNGTGGRGDGTFAIKVDYPAGNTPTSVATGDFNSDGVLDLAVANQLSNNVSIFLGNGSGGRGDGTFAAKVDYPTGTYPMSVIAVDFNSDSILDLAVANFNSNTVSILLGKGNGTFATKVNYATGTGAYSVAAGDFNSDSILDLAVANGGNNVSVLLGNGTGGRGDGTFATKVDYPVGNTPTSVATGDFNSDGILDLAVVNNTSNTVSILLGKGSDGRGSGTFAAKVDYPIGTYPMFVIAGDFNSDSILDLAVTNNFSNTVSVLSGNGSVGRGDGTFAAKVDYSTGRSPESVTTGDFNNDGILDLAVMNLLSNSISVLLGNGVCR